MELTERQKELIALLKERNFEPDIILPTMVVASMDEGLLSELISTLSKQTITEAELNVLVVKSVEKLKLQVNYHYENYD